MNSQRLFRLTCGVRRYAWGDCGAPGRPPGIASLLGLAPDGGPFAELWMGGHASLPAVVADWPGSPRLDVLVRAQGEAILGPAGGTEFPFLLKVLSCAQPLSLQAHPDQALAARLHAQDPECYPDDRAKPEVAIALTPFTALVGLRPFADLVAEARRLPPLQALCDGLAAGPGASRQALGRLLTLPPERARAILDSTAQRLPPDAARSDRDRLFDHCLRQFPGDPAALAPYVLNLVRLQPGEAVGLPPGEPHAYIEGTIIECMSPSDNVVRAGLTAKRCDPSLFMEMLPGGAGAPAVTTGLAAGPGLRLYGVPTTDLQVELRDIDAPTAVPAGAGGVAIILVLDGALRLTTAGWSGTAPRGTVLLWPAALPAVQVEPAAAGSRWVRAGGRLAAHG
ncbi:MAG: mannose-6-phosphate isomerase, class I [Lentisphaerae bacterium]|nr:mannose-6-phosphate isomerase, class I [Lentisphaerota bacterium]